MASSLRAQKDLFQKNRNAKWIHDKNTNNYYIKNKEDKYPIIEEETGTTIYTKMQINLINEIDNLNIDYTKGMDLLGNTVVVPIIKMICDRVLENEVDER